MNGTSLSTFMNFSIILFECLFSGFQRFIVVTSWFGFNLFVKLERIACSVGKVSSFESKKLVVLSLRCLATVNPLRSQLFLDTYLLLDPLESFTDRHIMVRSLQELWDLYCIAHWLLLRDFSPVVLLVHLNTGAAYHLCHSRGKFVAKNLTFLPCIGLSESRMRGVVYVLGMLCFILFNARDLTRPTILKEEASLSSILRPES
ncbi:hypothetical protein Peur_009965 [Populus x canadensis]